MLYRYDYDDKELKYYEKLNRCTIENDCVLFMTDDGIYKTSFHELVRFIIDFYEDCFIGNADDLCDYIRVLAEQYELDTIIKLVDDLDITNEYYIVDYYNNIIPFNNMDELSDIYDVADIISDMIEKEETDNYCELLDGF